MQINRQDAKKRNPDYYIKSKYFGLGNGQTCCYCNEIITSDDRMMSVAIIPGASSEAIHSHAECYEYIRQMDKSEPSQDWRIINDIIS